MRQMLRLSTFLTVLATAAPALAAETGTETGYMHHGFGAWGGHMGGHWGGGFLGPIFMIVVLAVVIALVVMLVRRLGDTPGRHDGHPGARHRQTPLDILEERFARGEVEREEFEERRKLLGG